MKDFEESYWRNVSFLQHLVSGTKVRTKQNNVSIDFYGYFYTASLIGTK